MREHASPALPWHTSPRRRLGAGGALLLAVLLAHGLRLGLLPGAPNAPGQPAPRRAPALALLSAPATMPRLPVATAEPQAVMAAPLQGQAATPAPRAMHAALAGTMARGGAAMASPHAAASAAAPTVPDEAAAESEIMPQPTAAGEVPVYATRLPDSATLHDELQRAAISGTARLTWQRYADAYELSLAGSLQGMPVLASTSRCGIDAQGVSPLRHAELRRAREVRAVNFQREAGRISFSGPHVRYALLPGAQDRLSWIIQLPAIIEADPALARPGARVTLYVVGTRGDAEAWSFEEQGRQALELAGGIVPDALHLLREPRRPYDARVEVWLDPARQHLPVRALFTTLPGGQPLELRLSYTAGAPP
jgi:hypothetical protein